MDVVKRHPEFDLLLLKHEPVLSLYGLKIDMAHRKVHYDEQEIRLIAKEYDLLSLLVANKGYILTYDQIYRKVWIEEEFGTANNAIACHIHNLREKLKMDSASSPFSIRCIRETGYCFEVDSEKLITTLWQLGKISCYYFCLFWRLQFRVIFHISV